jgi:SAM-dependent methyltransferase
VTPTSVYDSSRVAAGYAFHRPPVHGRVVELVATHLRLEGPVRRGLDVGCGAGRSTAALAGLARGTVGLEPAIAMLEHRRQVAPGAQFTVGRAEALPFAARTFDLVTAAGSLNYVDLRHGFEQIERVLAPGGWLVIYDFSSGRCSPGEPGLAAWFDAFERRYPFPPGYAMDVRALGYEGAGLALDHYEDFEVLLPMARHDYLEYVLTEANVERALQTGLDEPTVRAWCASTLAQVFGGTPLPVAFTGYFACVRRA